MRVLLHSCGLSEIRRLGIPTARLKIQSAQSLSFRVPDLGLLAIRVGVCAKFTVPTLAFLWNGVCGDPKFGTTHLTINAWPGCWSSHSAQLGILLSAILERTCASPSRSLHIPTICTIHQSLIPYPQSLHTKSGVSCKQLLLMISSQ